MNATMSPTLEEVIKASQGIQMAANDLVQAIKHLSIHDALLASRARKELIAALHIVAELQASLELKSEQAPS